MSVKTLIPTVFKKEWEKNLENELVVDILSASSYGEALKFGDEADVKFPLKIKTQKWDGGDLVDVTEVSSSVVKVKADHGSQVNFEIPKADAIKMESAGEAEAMKLAQETTRGAIQDAAETIDTALANLYPTSGVLYKSLSSAATAITVDNVLNLFSVMKAKFSRAKSWETGKMVSVIPPELTAILNQVPNLTGTESGFDERKKGFVREISGWKIYESNNIKVNGNEFYPLFGIKGGSLASVKQKDLDLMSYMREKSLNEAFKGGAVWGVGSPYPAKLGTARISVTL